MTTSRMQPPHLPHDYDPADADLFDYAKLRDYLGFARRSIWRHRLLTAIVALATVGIAAGALRVLPKKYHVEMKIQAQRNQTISALAGIDRALEIEAPTRNAGDLVLRTDNLISLVQKTGLAQSWQQHRAPLQKLKDAISRRLHKPPTDEQLEDMLVGTLEQQITVTTAEDSITIAVDWWDPTTAYRLTTAAYENFLEARQFRETAAISEAIGLLDSRSQVEREKVETAVEHLIQLRGPPKVKPGVFRAPVVRRTLAAPVSPELQRVRDSIRAKEQAIADLQEMRLHHISELDAKLSEIKQVYSENHPAVLDLVDTIRREEQSEPPQLHSLREELRQLQDQYAKMGGGTVEPTLDLTKSKALPIEALRLTQTEEVESPEVESAKGELRYQMARYSALIERADQVRMERETQEAAFRYRYSVLRPAMMPVGPSKPSSTMVLFGALLAGIMLGFGAALISDLRSQVIYERWQIVRLLKLDVLGEVKLLQ